MIVVLGWKEYREHRAVWATVAAGAVLLLVVVAVVLPAFGGVPAPDQDMTAVVLTAVGAAVTYGLVCGAMMLAGEREGGTLTFLEVVSGQRLSVWGAKVLAGVALTLLQGVLVAGVVAVVAPAPPEFPRFWYLLLPLVALDAFVWGLVASALCETVLAAAGLGVAFLAGAWVLAMPCGVVSARAFFLVRGALMLLAPFFSALIFLQSDLQRTTGSAAPAIRLRRVPLAQTGPLRTVLWLCARQGWGLLIGLAVLGLFLGMFLPAAGPFLWLGYSTLAAVLCGTMVFAGEQRDGSNRFLGNQRFPLGQVWGVKIGFWLGSAMAVAALMFLVGLLVDHVLRAAQKRAAEAMNPALHDSIALRWENIAVFLPLGLAYGFSLAQFYGLIWRKGVVAVVVSLAASAAVVGLWVPSLLLGGLHLWQVLVPPLVLLAASRLVVWDWASTGLWLRKPALRLTAGGLLASAWVAGSLWYRVLEVPDLGQPFDVAAVLERTTIKGQEKVSRFRGPELRDQLLYQERLADQEARPLDKRPVPNAGADASRRGTSQEMVQQALDKGWPADDAALDKWLTVVFKGEWVKTFEAAVNQPLTWVENPDTSDPGLGGPRLMALRDVALLLEARAMQLAAQGQEEAALDHLAKLLALSRHLRSLALPFIYTQGQQAESQAVRGLEHWLRKAASQPALLRRAIELIQRHEAETPPPSEWVKAQYLYLRNRLSTSAMPGRQVGPHGEPTVEAQLMGASMYAPWERERVERLMNAAFVALLHAVEQDSWQATAGSRAASWQPFEWPARRYGLADLPGQETQVGRWGRLLDASWTRYDPDSEFPTRNLFTFANRSDIHAVTLETALVLYQAEQGKPAERLEDLVNRGYLASLPPDPFSGKWFGYRVSKGERLEQPGGEFLEIRPGQGVLWSVGPDGTDDGGVRQARPVTGLRVQRGGGADLIYVVPAAR